MNKKRTRILIMLLSTVCLILVGVIIFQSFSIHKNSNPKNEKIEQKDNYDKIVSNFKEISNDELWRIRESRQPEKSCHTDRFFESKRSDNLREVGSRSAKNQRK